MNKRIILTLILILFSWLFGQWGSNDISQTKGLKSEIRMEHDFEEKFGEWKEIPGNEKIHYKYDLDGHLIDESKYSQEGALRSKTTF